MKKTITILTSALLVLACASCQEKKQEKVIIVPPPVEEEVKGPQKMSDTRQERDIEWVGGTYKVMIVRTADTDLPMVKDESTGLEYYDNSIELEITRADGSSFLKRTFHKNDFTSYISNSDYVRQGVLLGIVFDKIENEKLILAASVGAPDVRSDEYVPLVMKIDRMGNISITLDTRMDTEGSETQSPGGITGDEEA